MGGQPPPTRAEGASAAPARAQEVPRPRARRLLDGRWDVPVTTVVAPAGFGKSTVLRQAVAAPEGARGADHLARCRPFDRDPRRLTALLLGALDAPVDPTLDELEDPTALADRVTAALVDRSPAPTCLLVDDVHELAPDEGAVAVLAAVVRSLPGHAHLVLSGRSIPPVPLARLRAGGDLREITADDLRFDVEERRALATRLGAGPDVADALPDWPALARLALAAGEQASMEYLREEVLTSMAPDHRGALAVLVVAGAADDRLLTAVGVSASVDELVRRVPMVDLQADGTIVAHALWHEVGGAVVDADAAAALAGRIAEEWSRAGRADEAVRLTAAHGRWDHVASLVMDALRRSPSFVTPRAAAEWIALVPEAQRDRPELLVLRGLHARLTSGATQGHELVAAARDAFRAEGAVADEAVALSELTWSRWAARDIPAVLAIRERAREIEAVRPGLVGPIADLVEAARADAAGDPRGALAALGRIDLDGRADPSLETMVRNWEASLHVLAGTTAAAVRCSEQAAGAARGRGGRSIQTTLARWYHGDPGGARTVGPGWRATEHLSARDRFLGDVHGSVIWASFGRPPGIDPDDLRARAGPTARDQVFTAVAVAAGLVVDGDEDAATQVLREAVRACGPDDPLAQVELVRFLPYALVLCPELRDRLAPRVLGPTHRRNLALADLLTTARRGGTPRWEGLPSAPEVFTALPLPWTLELAGWAQTAGRPEAQALVDVALDEAGDAARTTLRRLAEEGSADGGVARLLQTVPWPPEAPVRIDVLGPLRVARGGVVVDGGVLRRRRVRELLSLLVVRGSVSREAAMDLLWPDLDLDRARNNLAVTLRWLRALIEPDRAPGAAPYAVRNRGEGLVLVTSEHIGVDLHDARRAEQRGRRAEAEGDPAAALEHHEAAAALWRGEPLEDLRYVDDLREERHRIERMLVEATLRAGELRLAGHDPDRALAHAERVLDHDPLIERAHRLAIAAHLQQGDRRAARRAVDRCRSALTDAGLPLGDDTLVLERNLAPGTPQARRRRDRSPEP